MEKALEPKRLFYVDILRIIAIFCVLYNHYGLYEYFSKFTPMNAAWIVLFVLSLLSKCGPPLFFMISGALLLGREEPFKKLFLHRILRFIIIIVADGVLLTLYSGSPLSSIPYITLHSVNWYFYAYLCFLILLPFLRMIAQKCKESDFKLFFILVAVFYTLNILVKVFGWVNPLAEYLPFYSSVWPSVCWNIAFPLLGYYIANYPIKTKYLAIGSIASLIFATLIVFYSMNHNGDLDMYEAIRQGFIMFPTCLIFALCKNYSKCKNKLTTKIISEVAGTCFGIFIVDRSLCISDYNKAYIEVLVPASYYVPANLLFIVAEFVVAGLVIYLLRLIPGVRKFI